MLILSQNKSCVVNFDRIIVLKVYDLGREAEKRYRILAYDGTAVEDCWGIGDYATEKRAKEILSEIVMTYGSYYHRNATPAILRGSADIPEATFVPPKVYEMPEE